MPKSVITGEAPIRPGFDIPEHDELAFRCQRFALPVDLIGILPESTGQRRGAEFQTNNTCCFQNFFSRCGQRIQVPGNQGSQ